MNFAVFDTETTGLPAHPGARLSLQPRIIEFAGIITDGEEILHSLEFIIDPGVEIEPIITKITGLTNDDLRGKPKFEDKIDDLLDFFSRARGRIAHNLPFDRGMLEFDLARINKMLTDIGYVTFEGGEIELCTIEQTFHKYGKAMKLQDLYNLHFGNYTQDHRAASDVMLLHKVAKAEGVYDTFLVKP